LTLLPSFGAYPHLDRARTTQELADMRPPDSLHPSGKDLVKRGHLDEWVQAVSKQGGFRRWRWDVAKQTGDVLDILGRHCTAG
jgi:hypothetical protein